MLRNKLTSHPEFLKALSCLDKLDASLASARKTYGNPPDRFEPATFPSLVRIILGQQISRQVAKVLWQRLQKNGWQEADALAGLNYDDLQSVGLSRRKAEYVIELARAETDGRLNLKQLNKQPAEEFSTFTLFQRLLGPSNINSNSLKLSLSTTI